MQTAVGKRRPRGYGRSPTADTTLEPGRSRPVFAFRKDGAASRDQSRCARRVVAGRRPWPGYRSPVGYVRPGRRGCSLEPHPGVQVSTPSWLLMSGPKAQPGRFRVEGTRPPVEVRQEQLSTHPETAQLSHENWYDPAGGVLDGNCPQPGPVEAYRSPVGYVRPGAKRIRTPPESPPP